jgi:4-amino-4-deoxy-L-arabinose transferase-like glycosyltransferase
MAHRLHWVASTMTIYSGRSDSSPGNASLSTTVWAGPPAAVENRAVARDEAGSWAAARWALALVILLAAGLRLWGIFHDLPFSYYGDELHFMKRSMALGTGDLNPHWFHKPAFLMYLLAFAYGIFFGVGLLFGRFESVESFGAEFLAHPADFLLIGRLVVFAFGVATVWVVYRIAWKVFANRWAGVAAGLVAAVLPPMVASSQVIKSDVPAGFFIAASVLVYLGARESGRWKGLAFAAFLAGVSMGTHYYAIVLVPAYVLLEGLRGFAPDVRWRAVLGRGALVVALFVAGFFVVSPYNFLDPTWPSAFGRALVGGLGLDLGLGDSGNSPRPTLAGQEPAAGEAAAAAAEPKKKLRYDPDSQTLYEPGPAAWAGAGVAFFGVLGSREAVGLAFTLLAAIGLFWTLARPETRLYGVLFAAIFVTYFFAAITYGAFHAQPRHLNALYPLIATLVWPGAVALAVGLARFARRTARKPAGGSARRVQTTALVLVALAAVPAVAETARENRVLNRLDSRLVAFEWIQENLPEGDRILVDDYGPVLNPNRAAAVRMERELAQLPKGPFTYNQEKRLELLRKHPPRDGRDIVELGHQWWLPEERTNEELRSSRSALDMGNPVVSRVPKTLDEYRRDGVRWVVTNSEARLQYFKLDLKREGFPSFVRFYRELDGDGARLVKTFDPQDWGGKGPEIWVYEIVGARAYTPSRPAMSSSHSSGRSQRNRAISSRQRSSRSSSTSTPWSRRNCKLPGKLSSSPTTTRGIPNWTTVPAHIMQGLSVV